MSEFVMQGALSNVLLFCMSAFQFNDITAATVFKSSSIKWKVIIGSESGEEEGLQLF